MHSSDPEAVSHPHFPACSANRPFVFIRNFTASSALYLIQRLWHINRSNLSSLQCPNNSQISFCRLGTCRISECISIATDPEKKASSVTCGELFQAHPNWKNLVPQRSRNKQRCKDDAERRSRARERAQEEVLKDQVHRQIFHGQMVPAFRVIPHFKPQETQRHDNQMQISGSLSPHPLISTSQGVSI
jgi:hypothetical protein